MNDGGGGGHSQPLKNPFHHFEPALSQDRERDEPFKTGGVCVCVWTDGFDGGWENKKNC